MIAKVSGIIEKTTGKGGQYLCVQMDVDGKKVVLNSFDNADNATFKQAKESGQFVVVETTKNEKGYDQITKVSFMADKIPTEQPPKTDTMKTIKQSAAGEMKNDKGNKGFALSYAKDLAVAGKIVPEKILIYAEVYRRYLDNELEFEAEIDIKIAEYVKKIISTKDS